MANKRGKQRKVASNKSDIVVAMPVVCADETAAVAFMEQMRWGDTPACPRCGDTDVIQMRDRATGDRNKRFLWRCKGCVRQFTVRVGTVLDDSPIPLRHWCFAFYAACTGKKGVAALEISRVTGISYKASLFLLHRVRFAMAPASENEPKLSGTIEADETYVGGRPRRRAKPLVVDGEELRPHRKGPAEDFKDRKTPVVAAVERGGRVRARVVPDVTPENLRSVLDEYCDQSGSRLMTDERPAYRAIGREFVGGHESVNHSEYEYVRGDVYTNTIEGFFGLLKKAIGGTYHHVSRKHLHRYVAHQAYLYNTRGIDDGERTAIAIRSGDGKRLTYKDQVGGG
jgi:transposase-like protein